MASRRNQNAALLFQEHPVPTLDLWERQLGASNSRARAVEQAKYYAEVGRLRRLARGLYAVTPIGTDPRTFLPDPYLVAAALRPDAILSHHGALDLLGHAHSVFHQFPYFTAHPRRTGFGVVELDRRVLDAATGWFLERHPEVSTGVSRLLARLEKRKPQQPLYLGGRRAGGHLQRRWNILVPPHLANSSFEGSS